MSIYGASTNLGWEQNGTDIKDLTRLRFGKLKVLGIVEVLLSLTLVNPSYIVSSVMVS